MHSSVNSILYGLSQDYQGGVFLYGLSQDYNGLNPYTGVQKVDFNTLT